MRQFHVLSDGKSVKELSREEYLQKSQRQHYLCGWISKGQILFVKGSCIIYLSLEQLEQVLKLKEA